MKQKSENLKLRKNYEDMLDLPHHVSERHLPMSRLDRAAQFVPFAALTGHSAAIQETARLARERAERENIAEMDWDSI